MINKFKLDMKNKIMNRREALSTGVKLAAGFTFFPTIISANALRLNKREFNIIDYGAVGDGKTLDTVAIQHAINAAFSTGGGARVVVPGGYRFYTGTIEMKSNIEFHLADNTELLISINRDDYKGGAAITSLDIRNLKVTGTGNINGQALEFMTHYDEEDEWWRPKNWRPRLFQLFTCRGLEVQDISFGNAPLWGLHMIGCEDVLIDHLTVRNHLDLPNCDGINPDHCRNVEIKNCDIRCGDDAIVIKATRQDEDYGPSANIHVYDCVLETQDSGVKIGTETVDDIHDILFERCEIKQSCRGCTIQLRDKGNVYNVEFRDINFMSKYFSDPWWGRGEAISFTAIPRTHNTRVGSIYDIQVSNINARSENSIRINGTPESRIRNINLKNVNLEMERWTKYPGGLFDNRPTEVYPDIETHDNPGYSIRFADNVVLRNCSLEWGENLPDYFTHALEAENITGLKLTDFKGESAHPDRYDSVVVH